MGYEQAGMCNRYCSHGGVCIVDGPHETHDTGRCTFSDAEAVSKVEADALMIAQGKGDIVDLENTIFGLLEMLDE